MNVKLSQREPWRDGCVVCAGARNTLNNFRSLNFCLCLLSAVATCVTGTFVTLYGQECGAEENRSLRCTAIGGTDFLRSEFASKDVAFPSGVRGWR